MQDAFISYASADAARASRVERALTEGRLRVWRDRSKIRLGALLRDQLQAGIRESRVVVLLWSKTASRSRWVAAEILTAYRSAADARAPVARRGACTCSNHDSGECGHSPVAVRLRVIPTGTPPRPPACAAPDQARTDTCRNPACSP